MITIVDYGMGNLRSVQNRLKRMGVECVISSDLAVINKASRLILPGVGHFAQAMKKLYEYGLADLLYQKVINEKTPVLGICLGMQLFSSFSEEGDVAGLGWIRGRTVRFHFTNDRSLKIPHMGWNNVVWNPSSALSKGMSPDELFYFVHSYHVVCDDVSDVEGITTYGLPFTSAIRRDHIFGTQFHPEKSHHAGTMVLMNFLNPE